MNFERLSMILLFVVLAAGQACDWEALSQEGSSSEIGPVRLVGNKTLSEHKTWVLDAAFSYDNKRLVTGSWDHTAKVWNTNSGLLELTLQGHSDGVISVNFTPDDQKVLTVSWDNTAKIWDAKSGAQIGSFNGLTETENSVTSPRGAFSIDGKQVITWQPDNSLKILKTENGNVQSLIKSQNEKIERAIFSENGERILVWYKDNSLKIFDAKSGAELIAIKGQTEKGLLKNFYSYGSNVLAHFGRFTVKVWDINNGAEEFSLKEVTDEIANALLSFDAKKILIEYIRGVIKVVDVQTKTMISELKTQQKIYGAANYGAAFSRDGKEIVWPTDTFATVWNVEKGVKLLALEWQSSRDIKKSTFSPNGKMISIIYGKHADIWYLSR